MTQPQQQVPQQPAATTPATTGVIQVPPVTMPLCTRVWTKALFSDPKLKIVAGEPLLWQFDQPHPYVATYKITRMYVVPMGAVEVFSSDGGTTGLRHTLPWHEVLLIEEAMDAKTFVEEMEDAEAGDDDDDEGADGGENEEEEGEPKPLDPGTNGAPLVPLTSGGGQG
ncbi:MAG TPA: hypothetical protein VMI75_34440 [Polyangiaceae bacterium]|nr:hypothetical protein [Polyangiaceae bacterium]